MKLLLLSLALTASNVLAQTAPAPTSAVTPAPAPTPEPVPSTLGQDCHSFLANPVGGEIFYDDESGRLFILSYVGDKENDADDWANVIEVDLKKREGFARAALQLNRVSSIIGHYRPVSVLTIFSFYDDNNECRVGQGGGVSFALTPKPSLQRSYPQQDYEMARADTGVVIIDRKTNVIRDLDFATLQRKVGRKIPANDRIVFWREKNLRLLAVSGGEKKVLYRLNIANGKKEGEVRLRPQQQILQDGEYVAFVERVAKGNLLKTQYVPRWSREEQGSSQDYALPDHYPVDNAAMTWDAAKNRILVWGGSPLKRRQWDKAFLFSGDKGQPVAIFDVPKNQYISAAVLVEGEPLLLLKNSKTHNISALMLRQKKSGKFMPIRLLLKERPGQKLDVKEDSPKTPASP